MCSAKTAVNSSASKTFHLRSYQFCM